MRLRGDLITLFHFLKGFFKDDGDDGVSLFLKFSERAGSKKF